MKSLIHDHDVGFFILADEEPTINKTKFVAFCEELIRRDLGILWGINTRVTDIVRDEALLPLYRKAGSRDGCGIAVLQVARLASPASRRSGTYARGVGHMASEPRIICSPIAFPPADQKVLRASPPRLASRLLLKAIAGNAWAFAGSGTFKARNGSPAVITISNCPICRGAHADRPICTYYAATFERLYAKLVPADTRVVETACAAEGGSFRTDRVSMARRCRLRASLHRSLGARRWARIRAQLFKLALAFLLP
jgi:hypothetical protein